MPITDRGMSIQQ